MYCMECTRENFHFQIEQAALDKICCMSEKCGTRANIEQLEVVFKDNKEMIEKL